MSWCSVSATFAMCLHVMRPIIIKPARTYRSTRMRRSLALSRLLAASFHDRPWAASSLCPDLVSDRDRAHNLDDPAPDLAAGRGCRGCRPPGHTAITVGDTTEFGSYMLPSVMMKAPARSTPRTPPRPTSPRSAWRLPRPTRSAPVSWSAHGRAPRLCATPE